MNNDSNNNGNVNYDVDPNMIFGPNPANGINPEVPQAPATNNTVAPTPEVPSTPAVSAPVVETPVVETPAVETPAAPQAPAPTEIPQAALAAESPQMVQPTPEVNASPVPGTNAVDPNNMQVPGVPQDSGTTAYIPEEKKKSKAPLIIIVVVLLACLCVGGYFAYNMFFSNPFKRVASKLVDTLKTQAAVYTKPYKMSGDLSFESSDSNLSILNDLSLNYELSINPDGTKGLVTSNILEKGNKLLGFDAYIEKNKVYFKSAELIDKVIYTEVTDDSTSENMLDTGETIYVIEKFSNALVDALSAEKINKEDVSLTLNGKTIKATSNYYLITKNNYKTIKNKMIDTILKDEKLVKILAKYSMSTVEEIKQDMKDAKEDSVFENELKVALYTKGFLNDVVGFAFILNDKTENKEYKLMDFVSDGEYINCTMDLQTMKATIEGKEDNLKFKITYAADGVNQTEFASGSVVTLAKDSYALELVIPNYLTMKYKIKVEENVTINPFDVTGAVNSNELTEEDSTVIMNNLQNILMKSETFQKIVQSMQTTNTVDNYSGLEG